MKPILLPTSIVAAWSFLGCGGASPPAQPVDTNPPKAAAPATAEATVQAPPVSTAAPAAPGEPAGPSKVDGPDADGADGVRRWATWDGPATGLPVTTKKAWVAAPNMASLKSSTDSFASVAARLVNVVSSSERELVYEARGVKYAVPAGLARGAVAATGLKKGAPILCSFAGAAAVGRVDAVDASSVTCGLRFMHKTRKEKLPLDEVLVIDGMLGLGMPVVVTLDGAAGEVQRPAAFLAASGDEAWVAVAKEASPVHRVKAAKVTSLDVQKPLAVGAACVAFDMFVMKPCKVTKVLDNVAYVVTFTDGSRLDKSYEWDLSEVAPASRSK